MKKFLFIIALTLSYVCCVAQGGQVAVLYHGDEIKTFYSSSAFRDAMAQAVDGDVLTLSPGSYGADRFTITKAITIRGAGIGAVDSISGGNVPLTSISGEVNVNVPVNTDGYTLSIEGINFDTKLYIIGCKDAVLSKCRIERLVESGGGDDLKAINLTCFQCIIGQMGQLVEGSNFYNCFLGNAGASYNNTYTNCLVLLPKGQSDFNGSQNVVYRNCIFVSEDKFNLSRTPAAYNCLWVGPHHDKGPFYEGNNANPERMNKVVADGTDIFVEGSFYVLNEAGKKYLGSDGTQVGIYGSNLPFSTKTTYPQIKMLRIAPESTSDGKLKIEFEID